MDPFTLSTTHVKNLLHNETLTYLIRLAPPVDGGTLPPQREWPSTRQVADAQGISIYKARSILLDLVYAQRVAVSDRSQGKTLRWYPLP